MYIPDHFREDRPDVLHDAMRRIGFATLVTQEASAGSTPITCRCCCEGENGLVLRGHVARANPVWKSERGSRRWRSSWGRMPMSRRTGIPARPRPAKRCRPGITSPCMRAGRSAGSQDAEWLRAHVGALSAAHEAGREHTLDRSAMRPRATSTPCCGALSASSSPSNAGRQMEAQPEPRRGRSCTARATACGATAVRM